MRQTPVIWPICIQNLNNSVQDLAEFCQKLPLMLPLEQSRYTLECVIASKGQWTKPLIRRLQWHKSSPPEMDDPKENTMQKLSKILCKYKLTPCMLIYAQNNRDSTFLNDGKCDIYETVKKFEDKAQPALPRQQAP